MVALKGKTRYQTIGVAVALLLLALVPRLWALDAFVTPDEYRWVGRSATFLREILTLSPTPAYADGFPGVTTRWAGAAGLLWDYSTGNYGAKTFLATEPPALLDFLTALRSTDFGLLLPMRVPVALITALCVAILYLLIRRLFGDRPALLAGLLLALEPFLIGLSRVLHHDALVSSFTGIAVLSLLIYLTEDRRPGGFLLLSGIATGLALLSKATAVFLFPYAGLIAAIATVRWAGWKPQFERRRIVRAGASLIGWGLLAAVVTVLLWPAMLFNPLGTLAELVGRTTHFASTPHQPGNYFMGQPAPDPGLLFYWVAWLFRTTPLAWVGLLASLPLFWLQRRIRLPLFALWAFVILFLVFMSLGSKKIDRYSLPAILLTDVLAGVGLAYLLTMLQQGLQRWFRLAVNRARWVAIALGLVIVVLGRGILLWPHIPYYVSYYNPLLGGNQGAAYAIMVGWGEGCDLAADYLNQQPNAADLDVAAWYDGNCFGPLFDGTAWDIRNEDLNQQFGLPWYAMDYVVTYANQVQRETPNKAMTDFFQTLEPEYVANIAGFEYARVYRVPENIPASVLPASRCPVYQVPHGNLDNQVWLRHYAIGDTSFRNKPAFAAGETVLVALRWRTDRPLPAHYKVFVHLLDGQGRLVAQADDWLGSIYMGYELAHWSSAKIMNYMAVTIPPATPPGAYTVAVGVYNGETGRRLGVLNEAGQATGTTIALAPLPVVRPTTPPAITDLTIQHPFPAGIELPEGLTLLGYDLQPSEGRAGERLSVALYWQAQRDDLADIMVALQLRDATGQVWGYHVSPPVDGLYPTSRWVAGEIVRDVHDIPVDAAVPPGDLNLVLLGDNGDTPLGSVPIVGRQHVFDLPLISHTQPMDLTDARFLGYDLPTPNATPGVPLALTLYWECLDPLPASYKLFVHLVDEQDNIWGQVDRIPGGGECPTTSWLPGEYLTDVIQLTPRADLPPGAYHIAVGLYDEATGARLPRADGQGDRILLNTTITVQ